MAGSKVPRDPNLSPEIRRFLDDLGRRTETSNIFYDLTATQATALLDVFTSALKGLVPASGGGTSNFLRADGTFAVPPGTSTGGLTLAGTVATTSGTTASITGLSSGKMFICQFYGVSHNDGGSQSLRVALSANNGAAYGTPVSITTAVGAAVLLNGIAFLGNTASGASHPIAGINGTGGLDTTSGTIDALQFSPSAGSFDAGAIDVYTLN